MGIVESAGVAAIEAHVRQLATDLATGLVELGATVTTPVGADGLGPLVCVASTDPDALVAVLHEERIVTSSRDRNLRISLHLYNVEDDVARILEALARHRHLLV
jgi:selenocysteine lyase/cysteine desulfurase